MIKIGSVVKVVSNSLGASSYTIGHDFLVIDFDSSDNSYKLNNGYWYDGSDLESVTNKFPVGSTVRIARHTSGDFWSLGMSSSLGNVCTVEKFDGTYLLSNGYWYIEDELEAERIFTLSELRKMTIAEIVEMCK